jgi:hypothetical protein
MKWPAAILVGLCAAPLAAIIVGTAADSWAGWLRVSSREGAAAYWMVMMALLGAVLALTVGICIARGWLLAAPNFWSALGTTVGATAVVTLVITGFVWLAADLPPKIDGRRLQLVAEVRLPAGASLQSLRAQTPDVAILRVATRDARGSGSLDFDAAREMDGQLIVPATLDLDTSAQRKMLHLGFLDGRNIFFPLGFGSTPQQQDLEWTDWIPAEPLTGEAPTASGSAYAIRYKVVVEPPPAPSLTPAQQELDADAAQEAAMRALAPDAPLAQWLVFTRYGVPQPRIDAAIAAIRARPDYASELAQEMLHGEHESSRDALRAIEHIDPPPAELAEGIAAVGREIARALRDLEKESVESGTYNDHVAGISTRFSAWMVATRALQEAKVADFVPQLQEIIEPARRLGQVDAIRLDVVRVASFYLDKWAGIAPLPTDPPPR